MIVVIGPGWTFLRALLFGSAAVAIENLALRPSTPGPPAVGGPTPSGSRPADEVRTGTGVRLTPIPRPWARRRAPRVRAPCRPAGSVVRPVQTVRWAPPMPAWPPPQRRAEGRDPSPRGPPVSPHALRRRATPPTPVSDLVVIVGSFPPTRSMAFPVIRAGRRPRHHFRGLLGLHLRCGPPTRRPTHGGPMSRELQQVGYPPCRLGSVLGSTDTSPGRTFTCKWHGAFSRRSA